MSKRNFILFPEEAIWRVVALDADGSTLQDVAAPPDLGPAAVAEQVAAALDRLGGAAEGVTLAVPSSWCVVASLPTDDVHKTDRKAMLYRLEERLPAAVEDLVADFITLPGRAVGVCVALKRLRPLVEALEARHMAVESVTPAALLAAQHLLAAARQQSTFGSGDGVLLIGEADQINVVVLEEGQLTEWALLPREIEEAKLQVDLLLMAMRQPPGFVLALEVGQDWLSLFGAGEPILNEEGQPVTLSTEVTWPLTEAPGTLYEAAAATGVAAVRGGEMPWIELRQGPLAAQDRYRLHRRALNAALAAAAVFLLALAIGMFMRGQRYAGEARAAERQMADDFRAAFPNWTVPPNIRAVLESEHRKLAAVAPAAGAGPPGALERRSALETLQMVLVHLPPDLPVRFETMSFTDTNFTVDGHLRSNADIDVISTAMRKSSLEVATGPGHRDPDGFWYFSLNGTRPAASRAKPAVAGGATPPRSASASGGPP